MIYSKKNSKVSKLEQRIQDLENILRRIEKWEMPYENYAWDFGSNGERSFIISLVQHGLYGSEVISQEKPIFKLHEPFHKLVAETLL